MEINTSDLIKDLDQKKVAVQEKTVRKATLQKRDLRPVFHPLITFIQKQIQAHQLAQAVLKVSGTQIQFRFETNVINLPFEDLRQLKRTVPAKKVMPVNVYLIVESPQVNRSKLRIDRVDSDENFVKTVNWPPMSQWIHEYLQQIHKNVEAAQKVPKATKKAQKSTRKKTSRTKRTTRHRKLSRRKSKKA